ncbi:MAG: hypothetical protein WA461_00470 [Nitrososphaeraceae archaeon]
MRAKIIQENVLGSSVTLFELRKWNYRRNLQFNVLSVVIIVIIRLGSSSEDDSGQSTSENV